MNSFNSLVEELRDIDGEDDPKNFVEPARRNTRK
jgi:hypothetical protein